MSRNQLVNHHKSDFPLPVAEYPPDIISLTLIPPTINPNLIEINDDLKLELAQWISQTPVKERYT